MLTQQFNALALRQSEFLIRVGADPELISKRQLPCFQDSDSLILAATSQSGRKHYLEPAAAQAWQKMHLAAADDSVSLIIISAFRSFSYQAELIQKKVDSGNDINAVLETLAPPGCSEHHSGLACDIGTQGCAPAEEIFETTNAFAWLSEHAAEYGFSLSFPRDNPYGYIYEPWHWCFAAS